MLLKFRLENYTNEDDGKMYYRGVDPWMTYVFTGCVKNIFKINLKFLFSFLNSGSAHLSHLGSIANSFINWSFVVIMNAVKETLCVPYSKFYVNKINKVLETVPIDELFLE
jgi:hypothetical protein